MKHLCTAFDILFFMSEMRVNISLRYWLQISALDIFSVNSWSRALKGRSCTETNFTKKFISWDCQWFTVGKLNFNMIYYVFFVNLIMVFNLPQSFNQTWFKLNNLGQLAFKIVISRAISVELLFVWDIFRFCDFESYLPFSVGLNIFSQVTHYSPVPSTFRNWHVLFRAHEILTHKGTISN